MSTCCNIILIFLLLYVFQSSQYSKLEKADILEMTVKHLRNLQRQQMSTALASDPNVVTKYRAGFNECASEVLRYMNTAQCVNDNVRSRLVGHLSGCLQTVNMPNQVSPVTQQVQQQSLQVQQPTQVPQQVQMQPLSVQIPQQHANTNNGSNHSHISSVPSSTCLLMQGNMSQSSHVSNTQNSSPTFVNVTTPSNIENNTQITGSFQIVPGNLYNGPVAVYLGQVNENTQSSPTALPVFAVQVPQQQNNNMSSPLMRNKENVIINSSESQDYCFKAKQAHLLNIGQVNCQKNSTYRYSESLWRPW